MTITIDLGTEIVDRLREQAARQGQGTEEYLRTLVENQVRLRSLQALRERKPPQTLADLQPRIPPPPGSNGLEQVFGQWPGDETDEEIQALLEEIS